MDAAPPTPTAAPAQVEATAVEPPPPSAATRSPVPGTAEPTPEPAALPVATPAAQLVNNPAPSLAVSPVVAPVTAPVAAPVIASALAAPPAAQPKLVTMIEPDIPGRLLLEGPRVVDIFADLALRTDGTVGSVTLLPGVPRTWQRYVTAALERWRFEPLPATRVHRVQLVFGD